MGLVLFVTAALFGFAVVMPRSSGDRSSINLQLARWNVKCPMGPLQGKLAGQDARVSVVLGFAGIRDLCRVGHRCLPNAV